MIRRIGLISCGSLGQRLEGDNLRSNGAIVLEKIHHDILTLLVDRAGPS
jgi:hypothetical protein